MVGAMISIQAPVNSSLGRLTGKLSATAVSFATGTLVMGLAAIVSGQLANLSGITDVPAYMLLGGALGAVFVLTATVVVGPIGAGAVAAAIITGQLTSSLLIDHAGLLGVPENPVTPLRALGSVALISGTLLIAYRRGETPAGHPKRRRALGLTLAAVLAMTLTSGMIAFQPPLNAELAKSIGDINSGFVNFAMGFTVMIAVVCLSGNLGRMTGLRKAKWWHFLGGVVGSVNTLAALMIVQAAGSGVVTASTVSGQLVASLVIDRFGFFGLRRKYLTLYRVGGILLLATGVFLIAL